MANNLSTGPVSTTKKGEVKSTSPGLSGGKRRTPARAVPEKGRTNLTNMGQMLSASPMQVSQQGVPYRVLVGDQNADPGYLRPPTQQDIEYGERLQRARQLEESGRLLGGRDPVAVEQRITAAERQIPTWRDEGDTLRESIYGKGPIKGAMYNVGDLATKAPGSELGLSAGSLEPRGIAGAPSSPIDFSGGRGADGKEEEEGEKKETFNIMKFLLGLLGLPLKLLGLDVPGEDEKKKKKTGGPRQLQRQRIPWQEQNRMNRQSYIAQHRPAASTSTK